MEKELQALLATPAGRQTLQELAAQYQAADGRFRPRGSSPVTFILVHERVNGVIRT